MRISIQLLSTVPDLSFFQSGIFFPGSFWPLLCFELMFLCSDHYRPILPPEGAPGSSEPIVLRLKVGVVFSTLIALYLLL